MEMLVKKYQQKYSKVREEMDRWDELQSRLLKQFRNASSIIERLEVLQDLKNYGALKSIVGIREAILGKQMSSLEVILQSLKDTMQEFNGIVMSFEKILRDGKHLANGASRPLTEIQKQQRVGIQPSIADCMDGLEFIYKRHHAELQHALHCFPSDIVVSSRTPGVGSTHKQCAGAGFKSSILKFRFCTILHSSLFQEASYMKLYDLKLSTVSSLMSKKPPPSGSDFGALQQLLTDQPNIPKEEVQSIFDIIFAGELC